MKLTIKTAGLIGTPENGDGRYLVRRDAELVGYILFRAGSRPWVVCDTTDNVISAHTYLRDARVAAKRQFAN